MVFAVVNFSNHFSLNHLRSCCLSFLVLAVFFTFVNLFTTTTTTLYKSTATTELFAQLNLTHEQKSSTRFPLGSVPLLTVDPKDVYHQRYFCSGRGYSPRSHRKLHRKRLFAQTINLTEPTSSTAAEESIPYDYDLWSSTPLMPRLVSECEHDLMMKLLKRFDQLTRKYSLPYMIVDGTLLGKQRSISDYVMIVISSR